MRRTSAVPAARRLALLAAACAALAACSGDGAPGTPAAAPPTAAAPSAVPGEARAAAERFLSALVGEDHAGAYALLTPAAQATTAPEAFAAARTAKNGVARSLGRRYELTGVQGDATRAVVSGTGRLADGTPVTLTLPVVATEQGWRVDAVPTAY